MIHICIIEALANRFKIGLLRIPLEEDGRKIKVSQKAFEDLCFQKGALDVSETVKTKLLIIPSRMVTADLHLIQDKVKYNRIVCLASLEEPFARIQKMAELGVGDLFFFDKKRMLMARTKEELAFIDNNFILYHIGIPYNKYPLVKISDIDYLIAFPTHVAIPSLFDRLSLSKNILNLISETEEGSVIVIKQHPVKDSGNALYNINRIEKIQSKPKWMRYFITKLLGVASKFKSLFPKKYRTRVIQKYTNMLNAQITDKSKYLHELTDYSFLGLEFFLKFVRKGLITGHSAGLFHALAQHIPVYNCSPPLSDDVHEQIKRNQEWLNLPANQKNLGFDNSLFSHLDKDIYDGDIIATIQSMIKKDDSMKSGKSTLNPYYRRGE